MKKNIFLPTGPGAAAFVLALPCLVFAATAGNTAGVNTLNGRGVFSLRQDRNISVDAAFDMDVILERKLAAGDVTNAKFDTSEWSMARFGCRIFGRVEPYVRVGWAHLKAEWKDLSSGTKVAMSSKSGFGWGFGVRGLIYEFKNPKIKITADGSYRTADLDAENGYLDGNKTAASKKDSRFIIREWQATLLAVGEVDLGAALNQVEALKGYKFYPYGGITYSEISGRLRLVVEDTGNIYHPDNIKSDNNFGIVAGLDLAAPGDFAAFNFEGRFISETALSAGLSMLF